MKALPRKAKRNDRPTWKRLEAEQDDRELVLAIENPFAEPSEK